MLPPSLIVDIIAAVGPKGKKNPEKFVAGQQKLIFMRSFAVFCGEGLLCGGGKKHSPLLTSSGGEVKMLYCGLPRIRRSKGSGEREEIQWQKKRKWSRSPTWR